MNLSSTSKNKVTHLAIEGRLTIEHVAELKSALMTIKKGTTRISVDLEKVTAIDVAGIQIMCSANRFYESAGPPINHTGILTPAIQDSLVEIGYEPSGECPEEPCNHCFWKGE